MTARTAAASDALTGFLSVVCDLACLRNQLLIETLGDLVHAVPMGIVWSHH